MTMYFEKQSQQWKVVFKGLLPRNIWGVVKSTKDDGILQALH